MARDLSLHQPAHYSGAHHLGRITQNVHAAKEFRGFRTFLVLMTVFSVFSKLPIIITLMGKDPG